MQNFIDEIHELIVNNTEDLDRRVTLIKEIIAKLDVIQVKAGVDKGDDIILAKLTFNATPVATIGICAKDFADWSFKPGRTKDNGVASVKIVAKGTEKPCETFFIITPLWKNRFFEDNGIEVPLYKVLL